MLSELCDVVFAQTHKLQRILSPWQRDVLPVPLVFFTVADGEKGRAEICWGQRTRRNAVIFFDRSLPTTTTYNNNERIIKVPYHTRNTYRRMNTPHKRHHQRPYSIGHRRRKRHEKHTERSCAHIKRSSFFQYINKQTVQLPFVYKFPSRCSCILCKSSVHNTKNIRRR